MLERVQQIWDHNVDPLRPSSDQKVCQNVDAYKGQNVLTRILF